MRYILVECQCFSAKFMPNPAQEEQDYPACSHPRDSSVARTWTWRTRVDISHKAIRSRVCRGNGLFFRVKGHHRRDRSEDILVQRVGLTRNISEQLSKENGVPTSFLVGTPFKP
jgi:hypothetical protein